MCALNSPRKFLNWPTFGGTVQTGAPTALAGHGELRRVRGLIRARPAMHATATATAQVLDMQNAPPSGLEDCEKALLKSPHSKRRLPSSLHTPENASSWSQVCALASSGTLVRARVVRAVKGGLIVRLQGCTLAAFLPLSLMSASWLAARGLSPGRQQAPNPSLTLLQGSGPILVQVQQASLQSVGDAASAREGANEDISNERDLRRQDFRDQGTSPDHFWRLQQPPAPTDSSVLPDWAAASSHRRPHPPATKARIIVSQRDALKTLFAASLAPGEVFQARVCGLTSYGVFLQVLDAGVRYVEVMLPRIEMERAGVDIERIRLVIGQGLLLRVPGQLSDQATGGSSWQDAPGSSDASLPCTKLLSRSLDVFWDREDLLTGKRLATFSLSHRRCSLKADGYRLLLETRRTGGGTLHACVAAFHMRMLATPGVESVTAREERRDWGQRNDGLQIWEAPRAERRGQASSGAEVLRNAGGLVVGAEAGLGRNSSTALRPRTSLSLALREGEVVREIAVTAALDEDFLRRAIRTAAEHAAAAKKPAGEGGSSWGGNAAWEAGG